MDAGRAQLDRMRLRPILPRLLPLLAVLACALAFAGCGGGSDKGAKDLLKTAFNTSLESADISIDARLELQGLAGFSGPLQLNVTGPYRNNGKGKLPGLDVTASIISNGHSLPIGITTTEKNAWITLQGQSYELGEKAVAQIDSQLRQQSRQSNQSSLAQLGLDPLGWVKNAKDDGTATVGGAQAEHVSGDLDVSKMLDDFNRAIGKAPASVAGAQKPQPLTDAQKKSVEKVVKDPKIDVYIAKSDKTLRRISIDLRFDVPKDQQAKVNGIRSGRLSFDMELSNIGSAKPITPPRNARPISELQSQIAALQGGTGAAAPQSGGSSGGSGSSSPNAQAFERYTQCLKKAGSTNQAALQRCAQVLNGG